MSLPASTGSGASLCWRDRSANRWGSTVVSVPEMLFDMLGSPVMEVTVAVLVTLGIALSPGRTTIVTVASFAAPAAREPRSQVRVAVPEQVPWLAVADTSVTPTGS